MTYLVDANVLSEGAKTKPDPAVIEWLERNERDLAVDPVILGELRFGILLLPRGKRRARLERWFERGVRGIECIPWDAAAGLRYYILTVLLPDTDEYGVDSDGIERVDSGAAPPCR